MIRSPADLKRMQLADLQHVAEEARQAIVAACLRNGGHLGASLGAVELAVALHFVFDSPGEPLIWDVGHQAYAHKLFTGRWDRFHTLRLDGGLSGFLARSESDHDVFGAGHSSTALSAALAMAYARKGTARWSVAIVGDGGFSAGLAFEALNNIKGANLGPLLVVLNDNQMSISANVGALSQVFSSDRAAGFFDSFGLDYVGPIDGHNLGELIGVLQGLRERGSERPVLLHVLTQKGKGYAPAEESPAIYHGVSPVQEKTAGKPAAEKQKSYSEAFGEALCELAERDPRVVAITAAMPEGTGLSVFARRFPDRFFDVGIAEPHAVTFAAGLATQGFRPVVAIYSTFLQRALDAVVHDVALQGLGVTLAIDRAGLVGADGPTHHGSFDLAYLGMVPGLHVSAPACLQDLASELCKAVASGRPWAVRYPRGGGPEAIDTEEEAGIRWLQRATSPRVIAIGLGAAAARVGLAARAVDPRAQKVSALVVTQAKPVAPVLLEALRAHSDVALLVVEDGSRHGGFGQAVACELGPRRGQVVLVGYPDEFVPHGTTSALEASLGISAASLESRMRELLE